MLKVQTVRAAGVIKTLIKMETDKIKDIEVNEFTCECSNPLDCTICSKEAILIEQVLILEDQDDPDFMSEETELHRLDGKSKDYVDGFMHGLKMNPATKSVTTYNIKN